MTVAIVPVNLIQADLALLMRIFANFSDFITIYYSLYIQHGSSMISPPQSDCYDSAKNTLGALMPFK